MAWILALRRSRALRSSRKTAPIYHPSTTRPKFRRLRVVHRRGLGDPVGHEMTVDVEGYGGVRVAGDPLQQLDIGALLDQGTDRIVTEIVEAVPRRPAALSVLDDPIA